MPKLNLHNTHLSRRWYFFQAILDAFSFKVSGSGGTGKAEFFLIQKSIGVPKMENCLLISKPVNKLHESLPKKV
jgi:hypothetical protein